MPSQAHLSPYNLMVSILQEVNNTYVENGVILPAKQFFDIYGSGQTPHDCEQVTVAFDQMYPGTPGQPRQTPSTCETPRVGTFTVEVVRCVPTLKQVGRTGKLTLPDEDDLNSAAKQFGSDAWLLLEAGLRMADVSNYLGVLADVTFSAESGGFQATVLNLVMAIP